MTMGRLPLLLAFAFLMPGCPAPERPATPSGTASTLPVASVSAGPNHRSAAWPPVVEYRIDTIQLAFSIRPPGSASASGLDSKLVGGDTGPQTLRSVSLDVRPMPREPHAVWPNGRPVSADALVLVAHARSAVDVLVDAGVFSAAARYHSEARPGPKRPPPPGSLPALPAPSHRPHVTVTVTVSDEDWHHSFIHTLPWGPGARNLLRRVRDTMREPARGLMNQLVEQLAH